MSSTNKIKEGLIFEADNDNDDDDNNDNDDNGLKTTSNN